MLTRCADTVGSDCGSRAGYYVPVNGHGARGKRGTKILIGVVALVFTGVLVYFSAWPTLVCTRAPGSVTPGSGVDCAISARVLYLIPIQEVRVAGIRSVTLVRSATRYSETPPRLTFHTAESTGDLGYFAQRFTGDWMTLDAFARSSDAPQLRLTLRGWRVTLRAIAAHVAAFVLLLLGGTMLISAVRRG